MSATETADRSRDSDHEHEPAGESGGHGHHHHAHGPASYDRAFAIGTALNLGFVLVEAVLGVIANSVALLADAGHNLSDVLALLLAWGAAWLTRRQPTSRHTYGFGSSSILASLINAMLLLVAVGAIAFEAIGRIFRPEPVAEFTVIWVAAAGILVNGATAWMFMRGRERDINIRGAYLHMASDAAVSAGVVVAAIAIWATGWYWLDPLASLAISVVIVLGSLDLLKESTRLAMAAVPGGVDRAGVERYLAGLPGVSAVHDLHIWAISTTETALTAHLVRPAMGPDDEFLRGVAAELRTRFGIGHCTIQVEHDGADCHLAPTDVI
ncbi:MAG TPA: cation diffusion facilitator family transporter [Dongiaceae bacterium]|nr:cation diffusion facilitator family transporter [Dongiaceae bacterium]